jgi:transcriptional regulator with XRE-family HTH domain
MLAERLRELRKERRMTATQLAAAVHVSKSFISQLESGRTSVSLATLGRIAAALEVPTGVLLASAPESPNPNAHGHGVRIIYRSYQGITESGLRVIGAAPVGSHATVALNPGHMVRGKVEPGGRILLTMISGAATLRTEVESFPLAAGDVALLERPGTYNLQNEERKITVVLLSVPTTRDLPDVVRTTVTLPERQSYDSGGPLRLVSMRARRSAETVR